MAEYIKRESAIDAVMDVFYDTTDIDLSGEKLEAAILNVQAADVEPVQRWIPVDDRLPENGVHVLLCCEVHRCDGEIAGKYVCDGYYAEANKLIAGEYEYSKEDDEYYLCEGWYEVIKNWDDYTSVPVEDFVTHWMLLPEPPKGE